MAVKIAVANQKGGVGKTTTSICIAQELRKRKKKVLMIDSDAQCNTTSFYKATVDGEATLMDILCSDEPAKDCIQKTHAGNIIPADPLLSDTWKNIKDDNRRFKHLRESLKSIDRAFDYIIIDTPPEIGVNLRNVLVAVDYIVIPVDESGWSMTGLMDFAEAIDMARDDNPNLTIAGILTVKAHERTKKSGRMGELADQMAKKLATRRFKTKIRESVACAEALTEYYVPLQEYAPKSTTYKDYKKFVSELLEVTGLMEVI